MKRTWRTKKIISTVMCLLLMVMSVCMTACGSVGRTVEISRKEDSNSKEKSEKESKKTDQDDKRGGEEAEEENNEDREEYLEKEESIEDKIKRFKTNQAVNTSDKIELIVWESAGAPEEFIEKAGDYFNMMYPNIHIRYVNVQSTDANSKIVMDGPSGWGPDLFATAHNNCGVMAAGTHIEPVPDSEWNIVKEACEDSAFQGALLRAQDGTETLYGYPVSMETYALFYNKELISKSEIPQTMSELAEYIRNYDKEGTEPFLMDAGNAYYSVMFTSTADERLYGMRGNDITDTHMCSDAAVRQMADFIELSKAINKKTGEIDYKHNDSLFAAGQLEMVISGAWNIQEFRSSGVKFGITSIPSMSGASTPPYNFMGVRCMYVSSYSKHKPEAIAFAEFLMTEEMQKLRCELTYTMPVNLKVIDELENAELKAYMHGLASQVRYSYPMPNMSQSSLFWSAFASAYTNLWNGDVTDIAQELDRADQAATGKN